VKLPLFLKYSKLFIFILHYNTFFFLNITTCSFKIEMTFKIVIKLA
jgi:hypothetical protein